MGCLGRQNNVSMENAASYFYFPFWEDILVRQI